MENVQSVIRTQYNPHVGDAVQYIVESQYLFKMDILKRDK